MKSTYKIYAVVSLAHVKGEHTYKLLPGSVFNPSIRDTWEDVLKLGSDKFSGVALLGIEAEVMTSIEAVEAQIAEYAASLTPVSGWVEVERVKFTSRERYDVFSHDSDRHEVFEIESGRVVANMAIESEARALASALNVGDFTLSS